jgi:hypothetical protein
MVVLKLPGMGTSLTLLNARPLRRNCSGTSCVLMALGPDDRRQINSIIARPHVSDSVRKKENTVANDPRRFSLHMAEIDLAAWSEYIKRYDSRES